MKWFDKFCEWGEKKPPRWFNWTFSILLVVLVVGYCIFGYVEHQKHEEWMKQRYGEDWREYVMPNTEPFGRVREGVE